MDYGLPSGYVKMVILHSYVSLPEGMTYLIMDTLW